MSRKMTRWGIGPRFTYISILYGGIILFLHYYFFSTFTFTIIAQWVNLVVGVILISIGTLIFFISAHMVHTHINEGTLCTTGVYAYFRHPLYAAWIAFIVPGIVFLTRSIIAISWPIFMYIAFRMFIAEEDDYLKEKFGDAYLNYENTVNAVFPKLRKRA
jgi:protein-S-isoprenylcysteine O-methyltransferase Ste14